MSREPEAYRPILESIIRTYNKHYLSTGEVMEFTGRGRDWLKSHLGIVGGGTSAENLALQLSKL